MSTHAKYYLPPPAWKPKAKRQPSTYRMTAEEAAKRGLTEADKVPGTEETPQDVGMQSAGLDGVKPQEK